MDKDKTHNPQPQTPDMHRRKLLRGLSSVPVVATLTPVSASAVSLACTEKPAPPLPATEAVTDTSDPIVGGTYECLTNATGITPDGFNADVADPFNGIVTTTPVSTDAPGTAAVGEYQPGGTTRQCVIYVDGSGQYTYDSTGNNPISASCMLSLATP